MVLPDAERRVNAPVLRTRLRWLVARWTTPAWPHRKGLARRPFDHARCCCLLPLGCRWVTIGVPGASVHRTATVCLSFCEYFRAPENWPQVIGRGLGLDGRSYEELRTRHVQLELFRNSRNVVVVHS